MIYIHGTQFWVRILESEALLVLKYINAKSAQKFFLTVWNRRRLYKILFEKIPLLLSIQLTSPLLKDQKVKYASEECSIVCIL